MFIRFFLKSCWKCSVEKPRWPWNSKQTMSSTCQLHTVPLYPRELFGHLTLFKPSQNFWTHLPASFFLLFLWGRRLYPLVLINLLRHNAKQFTIWSIQTSYFAAHRVLPPSQPRFRVCHLLQRELCTWASPHPIHPPGKSCQSLISALPQENSQLWTFPITKVMQHMPFCLTSSTQYNSLKL